MRFLLSEQAQKCTVATYNLSLRFSVYHRRTEQIVYLTSTILFLVNHIYKSVTFHEYSTFIVLLIKRPQGVFKMQIIIYCVNANHIEVISYLLFDVLMVAETNPSSRHYQHKEAATCTNLIVKIRLCYRCE